MREEEAYAAWLAGSCFSIRSYNFASKNFEAPVTLLPHSMPHIGESSAQDFKCLMASAYDARIYTRRPPKILLLLECLSARHASERVHFKP